MRAATLKSLAVLALTVIPGIALAEPYTLFIYETPANLALRADAGAAGAAYWQSWTAYSETMGASGAVRGGAPMLVGPDSASDRADGLILSGYFQIDVADAAAAQALADAAPVNGGLVAVVPNLVIDMATN